MVRSSVAAETLAGQNGLDAIEFFQALMSETLHGITPREFRNNTPKIPSCLVIDSKGFYDAVTRSCSSQSISVERRLMIDYAIARETIDKQGVLVFWVNNLRRRHLLDQTVFGIRTQGNGEAKRAVSKAAVNSRVNACQSQHV